MIWGEYERHGFVRLWAWADDMAKGEARTVLTSTFMTVTLIMVLAHLYSRHAVNTPKQRVHDFSSPLTRLPTVDHQPMQCLFHNILLNTGRKYTTTARKVPKQLRLLPIIKLQPTVYTMSDSFVADSEPEREEERKRLKSQKRQKKPAVSSVEKTPEIISVSSQTTSLHAEIIEISDSGLLLFLVSILFNAQTRLQILRQ